MALAVLVPLTSLAVASVSAWLVVPYLLLMGAVLFAPARRPKDAIASPHFASFARWIAARRGARLSVGVHNAEGSDAELTPSPATGSTSHDMYSAPTAELIPGRARRGRGRPRAKVVKVVGTVESTPTATWVRVGPGKFVRVEGGSASTADCEPDPGAEASAGGTLSPHLTDFRVPASPVENRTEASGTALETLPPGLVGREELHDLETKEEATDGTDRVGGALAVDEVIEPQVRDRLTSSLLPESELLTGTPAQLFDSRQMIPASEFLNGPTETRVDDELRTETSTQHLGAAFERITTHLEAAPSVIAACASSIERSETPTLETTQFEGQAEAKTNDTDSANASDSLDPTDQKEASHRGWDLEGDCDGWQDDAESTERPDAIEEAAFGDEGSADIGADGDPNASEEYEAGEPAFYGESERDDARPWSYRESAQSYRPGSLADGASNGSRPGPSGRRVRGARDRSRRAAGRTREVARAYFSRGPPC